MPVSIHRTNTQFSLPSNWHRPSELLPYQSQYSMGLSSWILTGSILTSSLNSKMIPSISKSVFISTHTTIPFQVFSVRQDSSPTLHALLLVQTSGLHQGLMQVMYHMFLCQTCMHHKPYRLLKQVQISEKPWILSPWIS